MKQKNKLRLISIIMFAVAAIYFIFAVTHAEFGTVFNICGITVTSSVWKIFYTAYIILTTVLFVLSFPKRNSTNNKKGT